MKKLFGIAALATLLMIGAGCATAQTFTSARTLETGKTEVTLNAGATYGDTGSYYGNLYLPVLGVQVRHGVTDSVELGGGWGPLGPTGYSKFALLRSGTPAGGMSLALAPSVSIFPTAISRPESLSAVFSAELPVLLGLHLGGGHELTIAPRVRWMYASGGNHGFVAGGTLGMALRLSDLFVLTPELGIMVPVMVENPHGLFIPSVGLGMTWGR